MTFVARAGLALQVSSASAQFPVPKIENVSNPTMSSRSVDTHCFVVAADRPQINLQSPLDVPTITATFDAAASGVLGVPIDWDNGTILAVPSDANYLSVFADVATTTGIIVQWGSVK